MDDESIEFLTAGGTYAKIYRRNDRHHGYNFEMNPSATEEILNRVGIWGLGRWAFSVAFLKDSLDITSKDRRVIAEYICRSKFKRIVVTHGTDTIHKTARVISKCLPKNKVVILTGSNQPSMARDTDADFNLGMAVGAILHLEPGVYIALNGIVQPWYDYVWT